MRKRSAMSLLIAAAFAALLFGTGCSDDGSAEESGRTIDEAVQDAEDTAQEAEDSAQERLEKADDQLQKAGD